jgi:undecaprenyl-phosphate 4-deoxy-4-formamido-L-arabinose transferase
MIDSAAIRTLSTSIIIPLYNSAGLIAACHAALVDVIDKLPGESEIIYVDDGSRDHTLVIACQLQAQDGRVRVVELATNYGQHAAILAGIECARYESIVTLDVDLQCDPRDIPRILAPLANGSDFVSGVRVDRFDSRRRRLFSRLTTVLVRHLSGVPLQDVGCPLNALTSGLARDIARCGELRRFAKPLAALLARKVTEVEVRHAPHPSHKRASTYSSTRLINLFMDFLVTALGSVFAWAFMIFAVLAVAFGITTIGATAVCIVTGRPTLLPFATGALCAFSGLSMMVALVGEYMQRIYRQTSGVPMYIVRRVYEPLARHG